MKAKLVYAVVFLLLCVCFFSCCNKAEKNNSSFLSVSESSQVSSEYAQQQLADLLASELKQKEVTQLNFYYVDGTEFAFAGYKPLYDFRRYEKLDYFYQINGKEAINEFRADLKIDEWQACDASNKAFPVITMYFGNYLVVNLEHQYGDDCFFSINTADGRAFYKVPSDVYQGILSLYSEKIKAAE